MTIRVGRCLYQGGQRKDPGFTPIVSLTKSTKYGSLSPFLYVMMVENLWQSSKVYAKVSASHQKYSRWQPMTI